MEQYFYSCDSYILFMTQNRQEVQSLKKQVEVLTKQVKNYDWAMKAGAVADQYILEQNCILLQFAESITLCCDDLLKNIDNMDKKFSRRR